MKKLNKRGFTLVELLAVIVVLAIILVITVPTVLNSISSTRQDALDSTANSVAKYIEEQISLAALGKNEILDGKIFFDNNGNLCPSGKQLASGSCTTSGPGGYMMGCSEDDETCSEDTALSGSDISKLGLNENDYDLPSSSIEWDTNGNVIVILGGADGGKFNGLTAESD